MISNALLLLGLLGTWINPPVSAHTARALEQEWYHHPDSMVPRIFGRQNGGSNATAESFPPIGSPEWRAMFPEAYKTLSKADAQPAWLNALNAAKSAGKVPATGTIPIPVLDTKTGYPIYPNGTDPKGSLVCSASYFCMGANDVWDAPANHVGIAFDDGPLPTSSPLLYSFLRSQNQTATHFFIGSNVLAHPDLFTEAYEQNHDDIACHTWSHPYMTTLEDEAIVAELGWQLEIVRVSSGGRIPRYWRPPYGDVDNRVRAIATEVFGLTTVMWNHDSLDWELPDGPRTSADVHQNYTKWYSGPKSPGLIILSHELTTYSVQAFIDTYPLIAQNGWAASVSIPDLFGGGWYVNARNDTTDMVANVSVAQNGGTPVWNGYAQETASLGTTTHLTFTSTVVDGSTIALTSFPTATPSSGGSNQQSSSPPQLGAPLGGWEILLGMYLMSAIL